MLKAVVFDMDGTLLDINLNAFIAMLAKDEAELLAQAGGVSNGRALAAYGAAMAAVVYGTGAQPGEETLWDRFCAVIEKRCGVPLADPAIAAVLDCYERTVLPRKNNALVHAQPAQGAHEALDAVARRGLRTALFTNGSFSDACIRCRMGWGKLLDAPFELVTSMNASARCKPDARFYLDALERMGLSPEEVLMVGNDPKRDFCSPNIGLQTAYVGRGTPARATWCGSMADFAARFDEIEENFLIREELTREARRS